MVLSVTIIDFFGLFYFRWWRAGTIGRQAEEMWNGWFQQNTQLDMVRMDVGNPLNMFDHFIFPWGYHRLCIYIYVKVEEGHHVYIWYIITYICIYIYVYIYMYIYIKYVCNYACVYVYIHMCVCVCTYTYIYIYMFLYYWSLDPTFAPENPPCFSSSLRFALRGPGSDGENRGPKNKPWLFQY
jgi:hypothetical protein